MVIVPNQILLLQDPAHQTIVSGAAGAPPNMGTPPSSSYSRQAWDGTAEVREGEERPGVN